MSDECRDAYLRLVVEQRCSTGLLHLFNYEAQIGVSIAQPVRILPCRQRRAGVLRIQRQLGR